MSRATTSVGPAAANGTMILTGRSGYPGTCAAAAPAKRSAAQNASTRAITFASPMAFPLGSHHPPSRAPITPDTVTNALPECKHGRCDGTSAGAALNDMLDAVMGLL